MSLTLVVVFSQVLELHTFLKWTTCCSLSGDECVHLFSHVRIGIHIECALYYEVVPFSLSQVSCKPTPSGRCHDGRTGC